MAEEELSILLDTDIGTNIDDALALVYLLHQSRCDLFGITTVTGDTIQRARLAGAICRAFDRDEIPIHAGQSRPIIASASRVDVPHATMLDRWPHRKEFEPNTAVRFMQETIRQHPGEVSLLTIGPLTNVATLFLLDPEIPSLLRQHVMMAGLYWSRPDDYGWTETNARTDPHASSIVFARCSCPTYCIGLDVTTQCTKSPPSFRERFDHPRFQMIQDMAADWFEHQSIVRFHDPLAAACLFAPDLCQFQSGRVEIELSSQALAGLTHFNANADDKPHQVAVGVDADRFFEHYFGVLTSNH
jgi:inosine-uridine nucleoside N-ribohydrolase